jgi:hypothetical protein
MSTLKAFLCGYRHPLISPKDWQKVQHNAADNRELRSFLEHYANLNSRYDWGDDLSFFQAIQRWGYPRLASWGVCRPNVRRQLATGDLVIFIWHAKDRAGIGGALLHRLRHRTAVPQLEEVFTQEAYGDYQSFFNPISRWEGGRKYQYEVFEGNPDNYDKRCLGEPDDPGERWFTDPLCRSFPGVCNMIKSFRRTWKPLIRPIDLLSSGKKERLLSSLKY